METFPRKFAFLYIVDRGARNLAHRKLLTTDHGTTRGAHLKNLADFAMAAETRKHYRLSANIGSPVISIPMTVLGVDYRTTPTRACCCTNLCLVS